MIHPEPKVDSLLFLVLKPTRILAGLIYHPMEFIPLMKFSNFNIVREALASSHKVAFIFIIAFRAVTILI